MNKIHMVFTMIALTGAVIVPAIAKAADPPFVSDMTASTATSSDGLVIHTNSFDTEMRVLQNSSVGVRYQTIDYVGMPSVGSALEKRLSLYGHTPLTNWLGLNGAIIDNNVSTTGTTAKNLLLYDTWLSIRATSKLHFYLSAKRETFDNVVSLQKGIEGNALGFSAEYAPTNMNRLYMGLNEEHYNDTNTSNRNQIGFEQTVLKGNPHLSIGARTTSYSFSKQINNGYYDPPHYFSWEVPMHVYGNINHGRFWYDVSGAYGHQWAPWPTQNNQASYDTSASVSYIISPRLTLKPYFDSWSSLKTSGGFARATYGIDLQVKH